MSGPGRCAGFPRVSFSRRSVTMPRIHLDVCCHKKQNESAPTNFPSAIQTTDPLTNFPPCYPVAVGRDSFEMGAYATSQT